MPSDPAAIRPATLVDSCVLLDVITGDEQWADWSAEQIAAALDAGRVVINPLIYAEVSVGYETVEELDELLSASDYEREPLPYLAGFAAGKAFVRYRRGGGDKRSPMPDFYIGAHAAVAGYRLLTRDVRRYRTYFPTIESIAPAAGPHRRRSLRRRLHRAVRAHLPRLRRPSVPGLLRDPAAPSMASRAPHASGGTSGV